jgi:ATP-dependent DNA helicase PIF1
MPNVSARGDNEVFFLRMLLLHRSGTSFEDMRTITNQDNGEVTLHETYKGACMQLGLIQDDQELRNVMLEVVSQDWPHMVRKTFVMLLLHCQPSSPIDLMNEFMVDMGEDFLRQADLTRQGDELPLHIRNKVLLALSDLLEAAGNTMSAFGLPEPDISQEEPREPMVVREETSNYDQHEQAQLAATGEASLTAEQRTVYDAICNAVIQQEPRLFSLNACGGSGKTFLLSLICNKLRSLGYVALATAFSGIAATLLPNGRTMHSRFQLPLICNDETLCYIKGGSAVARLMKMVHLIILDEVTMGNRSVLHPSHHPCISTVTLFSFQMAVRDTGSVLAGPKGQPTPVWWCHCGFLGRLETNLARCAWRLPRRYR